MKLELLNEDIEAVKKYYPNIDNDTFMELISLDPTYRDGSNSVGKYGKWILNLFNKGTIAEKDFRDIAKILNQFTTYRNRVQNKDLNSYKTLDDLSDILAQVVDDDFMLSDRQKLRFKKNIKAGRVSTSAEDDYDVVFEDNQYIVYVPNTHEASMKLGKGTQWCTAHENRDWYKKYTRDNGKLYIIKDKTTGYRWQYSDIKGDFLNQEDEEFNVTELLNTDKKLKNFMFSVIGIEANDNGAFLYNGTSIDRNARQFIDTVIVDDTLDEIYPDAFFKCKNLKTVIIPNSVEHIGHDAFNGCVNLTSIKIPNSVVEIYDFAFNNCKSLKEIIIPDSVKSIGSSAFSECSSLESVTIPKNLTLIDSRVFYSCFSLKSITIPSSVKTISLGAFACCTSLEKITIPDSVTHIQQNAFSSCRNLESVIGLDNVVDIGYFAFEYCKKLTIYTDNPIVKLYCNRDFIQCKPLSKSKTESLKLRIKEDTACIPSKTSYMNEDGFYNGIYYFGDPKQPKSWRDYVKSKKKKLEKLTIAETDEQL